MKSSLANAVGGKTARACDSCVKRRARWYCTADDAFLCQACDGLVHSANPLARRHERVRLKSSSPPGKHRSSTRNQSASPPHEAAGATWHQGFTRKARTPRGTTNGTAKKHNLSNIFHDLVPEISVEDSYELEEQLICQVPVLDPTVEIQCLNEAIEPKIEFPLCIRMENNNNNNNNQEDDHDHAESCLNGFFPTDIELEEFAADVETLLGGGLDTDQAYVMEELGLANGDSSNSEMFKVEKEEEEEIGICCEDGAVVPFELSFDYESQKMINEEEVIKNVVKEEDQKSVKMLRLNYDAVITMWGSQGPPWTAGDPPELDLDIDGWPVTPMEGISNEKQYGTGLSLNSGGFGDGGREARVSRYREKRRTRLFSKKIRYEVRKLNAEKRPRMKGRFVKRTSLAVSATSPLAINY